MEGNVRSLKPAAAFPQCARLGRVPALPAAALTTRLGQERRGSEERTGRPPRQAPRPGTPALPLRPPQASSRRGPSKAVPRGAGSRTGVEALTCARLRLQHGRLRENSRTATRLQFRARDAARPRSRAPRSRKPGARFTGPASPRFSPPLAFPSLRRGRPGLPLAPRPFESSLALSIGRAQWRVRPAPPRAEACKPGNSAWWGGTEPGVCCCLI